MRGLTTASDAENRLKRRMKIFQSFANDNREFREPSQANENLGLRHPFVCEV
jgi:hypothetical protein